MKKQIFCFVLVGIAAVNVFAQTDKTVDKINKTYTEIAEKARLCETDDDQGEFGPLFVNELTINSRNHQWRAVGIHQLIYKFFYKGVENDERRLYPDQLVFVTIKRKESSRTYYEEYLYSDLGELIFYSQRKENDDQAPANRRIYFAALKTIRVIDDGKTHDKFSAAELKNIAEIRRNASSIKELFTRL